MNYFNVEYHNTNEKINKQENVKGDGGSESDYPGSMSGVENTKPTIKVNQSFGFISSHSGCTLSNSTSVGLTPPTIIFPQVTLNSPTLSVGSVCSPTLLTSNHTYDRIGMNRNHIREAIENNDPIEPNLHVVAVISNVCQFKRRYYLMNEFIRRMEFERHVILYVVELAYGHQDFVVTSSKNPRHLQLRTDTAIWHKENMVNLGIQRLLPPDWKAVAWIDGDIEFENDSWALDTLKILNGSRDVVQLFSHALDMDMSFNILSIFNSFSFQYEKNLPYSYKAPNYWHPGYAWACTRKAYKQMGGLFEYGILGSSDYVMACCIMNKGLSSVSPQYSTEFKKKVLEYEDRVNHFRLGYVPGVIRHYFHGSKVNRKYVERNVILFKHHYDPTVHLVKDSNGVLTGSPQFSEEFKHDIMDYFSQRNEDE